MTSHDVVSTQTCGIDVDMMLHYYTWSISVYQIINCVHFPTSRTSILVKCKQTMSCAASLTTCYTWRMLSSAIYGTVSFWCVLSTTQCHVLLTDWNVRPDRNVWRQQEYASVSRSMYARTYVIEQFSVALRNETCCEWVQLGVVDCLERLVSECLELSQSCVCVCDEPSDSFVELASCLSVVLIISKWLVRHILSSVTR